jgi:DNA-binding response OmpR family regulator
MKILIVEDQPLVAMSLAFELEHAGHEVIGCAGNLRTARTLAEQGHPGLALVDIDLDYRGEGIRVARELKEELHIPSVFVTSQGDVARAHADAAIGVIVKPFDPADVVRGLPAIASVLEGGHPPPPSVPRILEFFPLQ